MVARQHSGFVVGYTEHPERETEHEHVTRTALASKIAALKGYEFAGEYDRARRYPQHVFFVPGHTLVGIDKAQALGIHDELDLFGGVVPHGFVATKSITHPLAHDHARAPAGWSYRFPDRVRDVVLDGISAFSTDDARRGGVLLLARGPVRIKPASSAGGRSQVVVDDVRALDAALASLDEQDVQRFGVVLEQNLSDVETYSVGRIRLGDLLATYSGIQKLTIDNGGQQVYGGSDLLVARGDFDALLALELSRPAHVAVAHARVYDAAAHDELGVFASRRNYDVARGRDADGNVRVGVLEQSWRIGGATGPELAALHAFSVDPSLAAVHGRGFELYGDLIAPPPHATVYFAGVDRALGSVAKYSLVEDYVGAR